MKRNGFTLIEILVVLTITGILFGVGFASYRDFSRRQSIQGTAKMVQGDLRKAQQNAMSGLKPEDPKCNDPQILNGYNFNVDPSGTNYTILANCSGGNVIIGDAINLPSGITISSSLNPILFKVLGTGTNVPIAGSTIILTQDVTNNKSTIFVGSAGDIK